MGMIRAVSCLTRSFEMEIWVLRDSIWVSITASPASVR